MTITPSDPYAAYSALRRSGPVHRVAGPDGSPSWLVTRYDDVRRALADPRLSVDKCNALPGNYRGLNLPPALDANLLNMDPPDHTRIRSLVTRAFTPGRIEALAAPIRRTADELLAPVVRRGQADLVAEYAAPLPITVICDLLGVPEDARTDFRAWTDTMLAPAGPDEARAAIGAMLRFFAGLIEGKRSVPGDDLVSDLIAARDDDDRLSDDELTSLIFLILFAGYENVVHLIGNATLALLDEPALWERLRSDRSQLPAAVDELMRYDGPAPLAIRRFPVEDVEIDGVVIPAGETVLLGISSANRDAERFLIRTGSTSIARSADTSLWGTGFTTASVRRWRGWRSRSRWRRCWITCPVCISACRGVTCAGGTRSAHAACTRCRSCAETLLVF